MLLIVTAVCISPISAASLKISVDFSGMEPNETITADDLNAYRAENVMISLFNAEGNILAAKTNGTPSYLIYRISADEGNVLSALTIKSFASINDFSVDGAPPAGNEFGIYVNTTDSFDFSSDTPVDGASGMVGKKNHSWKLDKYVSGKKEVFVCIYFLNNSGFTDWVRFYSLDFSAEQRSDTPETEPQTSEAGAETSGNTANTDAKSEPSTAATDPVSSESADALPEKPTESNNLAVILIAAAAVVAVVAAVMLIKTLKTRERSR